MIASAYVHVPFCAHLCSYCAFFKSLNTNHIDAWMQVITKEIQTRLAAYAADHPGFCLKTVYFGGGTPSMLSCKQLETLCGLFRPYLDPDSEWTLEVNPETVDAPKLAALKAMGFNRLSVGIQSFQDPILQAIGRHHSARQALDCLQQAREAGFTNLSADLIFGLPKQTPALLEEDLDTFLKLDLPHLSIYSLQIEEDSVFGKKGLQPIDEDLEADLYEMICSRLEQAGYSHYEISSFARKGMESRHNLAYWSDALYFGFGAGAAGRDEQGYYHGNPVLEDYLRHGFCKEYEEDQDLAFQALMMGLRTRFGVDIATWNQKYNQDLESRFAQVLENYDGLLLIEEGRLKPSQKGMELLNTILVDMLEVWEDQPVSFAKGN